MINDVAHAQAQRLANVFWLLLLSEVLQDDQQVVSYRNYLGLATLVSLNGHKVYLQFIFQNVGSIEVMVL